MSEDLTFFSVEGGEVFIKALDDYLRRVEETSKKRGRNFLRTQAIGLLEEIFLEVIDMNADAGEARRIISTRTSRSPVLCISFDFFNELDASPVAPRDILSLLARKHPVPYEEDF